MAAPAQGDDSDDGMGEFMESFKTRKYQNAFNEGNWEEVRTVSFIYVYMSLYVNVTTGSRYWIFQQSAYTLHVAGV